MRSPFIERLMKASKVKVFHVSTERVIKRCFLSTVECAEN